MIPSRHIDRLIELMAALRHPEMGCSWDLAQTFRSIVPYTIEEAHEVADAVERGDREDLRDELGDLLLQVVFQARLAEEEGSFDFGGVVEAITAKLIRRHPHIFGPKRDLTPDEVKAQWAEIKSAEKTVRATRMQRSGAEQPRRGHLADVPAGFPALLRAEKLQTLASKVGFDWNDARLVLAKIREEIDEVEAVLDDTDAATEEIGDVMFAVVNLARHRGIDPEAALRSTNAKFERRFAHIEERLGERGRGLDETDLAEMEALWQDAKVREAASGPSRPASPTR